MTTLTWNDIIQFLGWFSAKLTEIKEKRNCSEVPKNSNIYSTDLYRFMSSLIFPLLDILKSEILLHSFCNKHVVLSSFDFTRFLMNNRWSSALEINSRICKSNLCPSSSSSIDRFFLRPKLNPAKKILGVTLKMRFSDVVNNYCSSTFPISGTT